MGGRSRRRSPASCESHPDQLGKPRPATSRFDHDWLISEIIHLETWFSYRKYRGFLSKVSRLKEYHVSSPVFTESDVSNQTSEEPVMISENDARQGPHGHEVLYVLGFGTTGAVLGFAAVLAYFELFRTLG